MPSGIDWEDDGESVDALDSVLVPVPDERDAAPDDGDRPAGAVTPTARPVPG